MLTNTTNCNYNTVRAAGLRLFIAAVALMMLPALSFGIDTCTNSTSTSSSPLAFTETVTGSLTPGSVGTSLEITVTNVSGAATVSLTPYTTLCFQNIFLGTETTVVDALPAGFSAVSMNGTGWACDLPQVACSRNDILPSVGNYPPITLVVDIAADSSFTLLNTPITVTATSVSHSIMEIWIGNFLLGRNDVVNTNIAQTCIDKLVKIGDSLYFDDVSLAVAALVADTPADIYLHQTAYDTATFATNTDVYLHGGRLCDFSTGTGHSILQGTIEITAGTLIPDRIIIL
ncbi:MAG: hypothetical protein C0402_13670 [Thermodesulfovibrio sp.]|nr:hypothetical protein [Thermodesulfovibrio sp.]